MSKTSFGRQLSPRTRAQMGELFHHLTHRGRPHFSAGERIPHVVRGCYSPEAEVFVYGMAPVRASITNPTASPFFASVTMTAVSEWKGKMTDLPKLVVASAAPLAALHGHEPLSDHDVVRIYSNLAVADPSLIEVADHLDRVVSGHKFTVFEAARLLVRRWWDLMAAGGDLEVLVRGDTIPAAARHGLAFESSEAAFCESTPAESLMTQLDPAFIELVLGCRVRMRDLEGETYVDKPDWFRALMGVKEES